VIENIIGAFSQALQIIFETKRADGLQHAGGREYLTMIGFEPLLLVHCH